MSLSSTLTTNNPARRTSRALIALSAAATLTVAGTGIASAADSSGSSGSSSAQGSSGVSGSSASEGNPSSSGSSGSSSDSSSQGSSDLPESPTGSLAELSLDRDVFGSITGADVLGSYTNGQFDYEKVVDAIASIATAVDSIASIAESISSIVDTTTSSAL